MGLCQEIDGNAGVLTTLLSPFIIRYSVAIQETKLRMSTQDSDVPAGYYLADFVLESQVNDSSLLSNVADVIPIIVSTFDNGARRTEQSDMHKIVTGGRWECDIVYQFKPASPSVSIQFGPSGRLGGLSLPVAQLVSVAKENSFITRPMSLSIAGSPRQGVRFKFSCTVSTSLDPKGTPPVSHTSAAVSFEKFKASGNISDILDAIDALKVIIARSLAKGSQLLTWYNELGVYTIIAFEKSLDLDLLPKSASHLQTALDIAPEANPVIPALQNNLGVVLVRLFMGTYLQETRFSDESISVLKAAAQWKGAVLPEGTLLLTLEDTLVRTHHPGLPVVLADSSCLMNPTALYLDNLHHSFMYRFDQSGEPSDLQEASSVESQAIDMTDDEDPTLISLRMNRLGTTLLRRFQLSRDVEYLNDAISSLEMSVALTPDEDASLPTRLSDLVDALIHRFTQFEDLQDIDNAIAHQRKAIALAPEGVGCAKWWDDLGYCQRYRYDRVGDLANLEESILSHRTSIRLTPEDDPALPVRLNNLGVPFMSRFEHLGDLADIDEAIGAQERAISLSPDDDPGLPTRLNNLGLSLMQRYNHTDDDEDLKSAVFNQKKAVELSPADDPQLPTWLHNLVTSLNFQLDLRETAEDLEFAITTEERAIELSPEDHPDLPTRLNNLGSLLMRRADMTGNLKDMKQAISAFAKATEITPEGHPDLPIWWSNLGTAYRKKYVHTGDIDAMQESILLLQKSVKMTPPDHADLPGWLNNLSSSLSSRFETTGDREDLEEAIAVARDALKLVPSHRGALRAKSLHNLGINLHVYLVRFETDKVLDEPIACFEEAVSLIPSGHAELPITLRALADAHTENFERFGKTESMHEAVKILERTIALMTEGQLLYSSNLAALASALSAQYELGGAEPDWEKALSLHLKSIQLTAPEHPDVTVRHNSLGYSYLARHRRLALEQDLRGALGAFRKAATHSSGTWMTRLLAAKEWAKYASSLDPYEALDAYKASVELVSVAASLRFTIQSRHQHLLETADISRSAAAVALSVGKVEQALEWLEQGRGLVWSQLSQLRAPIEAMQAQDPDLAERFLTVSKELESAGARLSSATSTFEDKMILQQKASDQARYAKEWDEIVATIRDIPGFAHFLRPLPTADLVRGLPETGYVVVINVHPDRCDAIAMSHIFGTGAPLHISLDLFSFKKAQELYSLLKTNLLEAGLLTRHGSASAEGDGTNRALKVFRRGGAAQNSTSSGIERVLRDLWTLLVEPIVKALNLSWSATPTTRIWWCTTGVLSFLPIHAAGVYRGSDPTTISDYAVSSYIPTVTMLTERATRSTKVTDSGASGLLLISQSDVPGMARIPGTVVETELVIKRAESVGARAYMIENQDEAKPCILIEHMQRYSCVHLACHASQNTREPLTSGFYLHGGKLELATIIQSHLTSADLAFLSACQTSAGDEDLSEEAVHLAAGMMAAGYRAVVAAMWSIQDRHGAQVADDFYDDLFGRSANESIDGSNAAYSLHYSVQKLRKQFKTVSEAAFLAWVPYVHFGL